MPNITQRERLYSIINNTRESYPGDACIHTLIEEQVKRTPDSLAAVCGADRITYRQLNQRANQLADRLRKYGVHPGLVVGVMTKRSIEMVVGIIAILKSGAAYLPLSTSMPVKRMEYILKNSGIKIILTSPEFDNYLSQWEIKRIDMHDPAIYSGDTNDLTCINRSEDAAYIIYTSGSSGMPKGVVIRHFSLVNRLLWFVNKYEVNDKDTVLQKTTYTFDVSVWEYLSPLLVGGCVCLLPDGREYFPPAIIKTIYDYNVTIMHFVPSVFNLFLYYCSQCENIENMHTLRHVFCSGDALLPDHVRRFQELIGRRFMTHLTNFYGPTEATIDVLFYDCPDNLVYETIPIGRPIQNNRLYVLGEQGGLAGIEEIGELCVAGDGLALGYLNDREKTDAVFLPAACVNEDRVYHTGDLAYLREDGQFIYMGRMDRQVKIKGVRIELGEIEATLSDMAQVSECAVVTGGEGVDRKIVAFLVLNSEIGINEINDILCRSLPEYSIPDHYIFASALPKIESGKINYQSLMNWEETR